MWIMLSINSSRYQCWQVTDLIWSIELSVSYVSLKSGNITYVEMSYVLAAHKLSMRSFHLIDQIDSDTYKSQIICLKISYVACHFKITLQSIQLVYSLRAMIIMILQNLWWNLTHLGTYLFSETLWNIEFWKWMFAR